MQTDLEFVFSMEIVVYSYLKHRSFLRLYFGLSFFFLLIIFIFLKWCIVFFINLEMIQDNILRPEEDGNNASFT